MENSKYTHTYTHTHTTIEVLKYIRQISSKLKREIQGNTKYYGTSIPHYQW